ncbi:MAG: alpha/beta hydrolase [Sulfitobacter sp.]
MSKIAFQGPLKDRIASFLTLNRIMCQVGLRQCVGQKMAPDWDVLTETGIRFIRHQFTHAMTHKDINAGRTRFNSLLPKTPDVYDVSTQLSEDKTACWFTPKNGTSEAVVLYCHGGGYTFRGPVTYRFAEMLAHHLRARIYMPLYRLTPEHPHPAQAEDALAAWDALVAQYAPHQIAVIGDSAGGHMALILLQNLKARGQTQPALCVGLSPWVDIGARGASMTLNDPTDLVQGWMALQFGRWLAPDQHCNGAGLSPIHQDFSGLAPLYLQAGGREVLRDMIVDFATVQNEKGASIQLDLWDDMPHNFQAYDSTKSSSSQALERLAKTFHSFVGAQAAFAPHLDGVTQRAQLNANRSHR